MQRPDANRRVLSDRYELRARLGSGGAGTVWRGHDRTLERAVAIKLLHVDLTDDPAIESRFRTEATSAAQLTHPNAVQVYDVGRDGSDDYLVMELVEGPSLAVLLRSGPLPAGVAAAVGAKVAGALGAAHEASIVHRDVKPSNVLLTSEGRAKLADFGIARVLSAVSARLTRTGTVLGTARYLAPEQLGEGPIDARADVYALGLVLFEALTGQPPFGDGSPIEIATRRLTTTLPAMRHLASEIPEGLEEIIRWATQLEPSDRPDDGGQLAWALARFVGHDAEPVLARRIEEHLRTAPAREQTEDGAVPTVAQPRAAAPVAPAAPGESPDPDRSGAPSPDADPTTDPTTEYASAPSPSSTVVASNGAADVPNRTATLPTPGPPAPQQRGADDPRRPSAIQWLLVLAIVVGMAVAALLYLGSERDGAGDTPGSTAPPSEEARLTITDLDDHDPPPGDGRERPDELPNAIDGDLQTFWPTESYHSAELGGLKDGVGFWVALEEPATLSNVEVVFSRDGGELELWLGDGPPADDQQPSEWGERLHAGTIDSDELTIGDLPDEVDGDTLLLWFTDLPPGGNGYRVEVRNLRVYGG